MMMNSPYKKRLIILALIILALAAFLVIVPQGPGTIAGYTTHIFQPLQSLRNTIFGNVPFSVGDIIYISACLSLLVLIIKWILFIVRFKTYKHTFAVSLLHTATGACIIYLLFFLGWGGNYYKASLREAWQLDDTILQNDSVLYAFDSYLIGKLNKYAPHYHPASFKEISARSISYYQTYTDISPELKDLNVKPSMFGQWMEYMGVQGYYNPFTGEAQVNRHLPDFLLPFVICHELAHQTGVAAEDDANLLAYVLGTHSNDTAFNYSAYFNLWLYVHSRVKVADSSSAKLLYKTLNPISTAHLDTLRAINKRYRSKLSRYSNRFYDGYLRFHHVEEGIESYEDVVQSAYAWEQRVAIRRDSLIHLP